ncbi:MAG: bifunctional nuclease family protein [Planctomycetes bacterium]|nr:bifunctional nuclease family protein [Planctomycetota bacterium]
MIEAFLSKLIINERNDQHLMILKEKDGNRILPIVISIFEAISIDRILRKIKVPRPLTHDLTNSIFIKLGAELDFVEIANLNQGTYFANLHFTSPTGSKVVVDCRPSDSIALAVRAKCPIMVRRKILEQASEIDDSE